MSEIKQLSTSISDSFTGDLKKNVKICDYFEPNIKYDHLKSDDIKNTNLTLDGVFTVQEKINGTHGMIVQISNGDIYFCSRNLVLINTENMGFKQFCTSEMYDNIKAFFNEFPFHIVYGEFNYNDEKFKFHVFDVAKIGYTEKNNKLKVEFLFLPSISNKIVKYFPDALKCTEYNKKDLTWNLLLGQLKTMDKCEGFVVKSWNGQQKFEKSAKILNPDYKHFNEIHKHNSGNKNFHFEIKGHLYEKCCRKYFESWYNEESKLRNGNKKIIDRKVDYCEFMKSLVEDYKPEDKNIYLNKLIEYLIVELEEESNDEKCIELVKKLSHKNKVSRNVRNAVKNNFVSFIANYNRN